MAEEEKKIVDIVVLPEMWNCPYGNEFFAPFAEDVVLDRGSSVAEEEGRGSTSPSFDAMRKIAKEKKVVLFGGSIPTRKDGKLFNTCFVFDSDGTLIATHHKMHLFDVDIPDGITFFESKTLTAGDAVTIANTKDFGNMLVSVATEYNDALLIVENNNIGWATIQQIIDRDYPNLFYTSKDLQYVDVQHQVTNKHYREERKMVAGFSTTSKTRPLIISKLEEFFREESVVVRSNRLIDELQTFVYINNRAEAMRGYNDDLVMSFAIGLWVRDTALRLRTQGVELTKKTLSKMMDNEGLYTNEDVNKNDSWEWETGKEKESLDWLL